MDASNDLSLPDEVTALYRPKIAEAWTEGLAAGERLVGADCTVGLLLNEAKLASHAAGQKWMSETVPALRLPFGLDTAERLMKIADTPDLADSANWRILPRARSARYALATIDDHLGEGTLARWIAATKIHPDLSVRDIDDLVAQGRPEPPEPPPAAAPTPVTRRSPTKPKALLQAEQRIHTLATALKDERTERGAIALDGIFVRSQVSCILCGREYWLEDPQAQRDVTLWIKTHLDECHADDRGYVSVGYVIERRNPGHLAILNLTDDEKAERQKLGKKLGGIFAVGLAPLMLSPAPAEEGDLT